MEVLKEKDYRMKRKWWCCCSRGGADVAARMTNLRRREGSRRSGCRRQMNGCLRTLRSSCSCLHLQRSGRTRRRGSRRRSSIRRRSRHSLRSSHHHRGRSTQRTPALFRGQNARAPGLSLPALSRHARRCCGVPRAHDPPGDAPDDHVHEGVSGGVRLGSSHRHHDRCGAAALLSSPIARHRGRAPAAVYLLAGYRRHRGCHRPSGVPRRPLSNARAAVAAGDDTARWCEARTGGSGKIRRGCR